MKPWHAHREVITGELPEFCKLWHALAGGLLRHGGAVMSSHLPPQPKNNVIFRNKQTHREVIRGDISSHFLYSDDYSY